MASRNHSNLLSSTNRQHEKWNLCVMKYFRLRNIFEYIKCFVGFWFIFMTLSVTQQMQRPFLRRFLSDYKEVI